MEPLKLCLSSLALARIDLEGQHLVACDLRTSVIDEQVFATIYRNADFSGATLSGHFGMVDESECAGCVERGSYGPFNLFGSNFTNTDFSNENYGSADFSSPFSPVLGV